MRCDTDRGSMEGYDEVRSHYRCTMMILFHDKHRSTSMPACMRPVFMSMSHRAHALPLPMCHATVPFVLLHAGATRTVRVRILAVQQPNIRSTFVDEY